jgi:uncharacterized membrane protein
MAEPRASLIRLAHVIYALHAVSLVTGIITAATVVGAFLTGWPSVIAVILNYAKRTFWFGLLWVTLCGLFVVVTLGIGLLIAWLPLGVVGLWFIYRIARGWLRLMDRQPMYA